MYRHDSVVRIIMKVLNYLAQIVPFDILLPECILSGVHQLPRIVCEATGVSSGAGVSPHHKVQAIRTSCTATGTQVHDCHSSECAGYM